MPILSLRTRPTAFSVLTTLLAAQSPSEGPLQEGNGVLLQVALRNQSLGDGIMAFPSGTRILLPLGEICHLIGFGIQVRPAERQARGFFIDPKRTFHLDLATRTVQVQGKSIRYEPGQVLAHAGEFYVDSALLSQWFPFEAKPSLRESTLQITSREALPIEQQWDRDAKNAGLTRGRRSGQDALGPVYPHPYEFLSMPMTDLSASWNKPGKAASKGNANLTLGGDVLWMSAQAFLVKDDSGSYQGSRATLFREDPDGKLLGPLRARRLSLGDPLITPSMELAGALPQGRGIMVDNYPTAFRSAFGTRVFRGQLPPGWSVELFHNSGLLGYKQVGPDGIYEFTDVPITFGLNLFRLVFHGPLGERREEAHRIDIQGDQPTPGTIQYRVGSLKPTPRSRDAQDPGRLASLAEAELGLTPYLSTKTGFMRLDLQDKSREFAVAGVRSIFPFMSLELSGAGSRTREHDADKPKAPNGSAFQALIRTGVGYSNLMASHATYRNGFTPMSNISFDISNKPMKSSTQVTANLGLGTGVSGTNLVYNLSDIAYLGESRRMQRLQATKSLSNWTFSPGIFLNENRMGGPATRETGLQLAASTFQQRTSFQGDMQISRDTGRMALRSWSTVLSRTISSEFAVTGGIRGTGGKLTDATSFVSAIHQGLRSTMGADLTYNRASGVGVSFRLQVSVGRDPNTHRWFTSGQSLATSGAVSARAFIDDNGNGRLDPGERIIKEAQFRTDGGGGIPEHLSPEVEFHSRLSRGIDTPFQMDSSSLEDPSHQPVVPNFSIRPRAGKVMTLDFPVVVLGEVNGTLRLRMGGKVEPFAGVTLELIDASGKTVTTQRTAFDGFFEFRNLHPQAYQLRIPPKEVERLGLQPQPPRPISMSKGKTLFEGQDMLCVPVGESALPLAQPAAPKPLGDAPPQGVKPPAAAGAVTTPTTPALPRMAMTATRLDPQAAPDPFHGSILASLGNSQAPRPHPRTRTPHHRGTWSIRLLSAVRQETIQRVHHLLSPALQKHLLTRRISRRVKAVYLTGFKDPVAAEHLRQALPREFFAHGNRPLVQRTPVPALPMNEDAWAIHLMPVRSEGTLARMRHLLEPLGQRVHLVHSTQSSDLFLGPFPDPMAAEAILRRLPYQCFLPHTEPRIVPAPSCLQA